MTTWPERFAAALAMLCGGKEPPAEAVRDWLDPTMDSHDLQAWALEHAALPWAQGIAVIDAARALADQPQEGDGHKELPQPYPARMPAVRRPEATALVLREMADECRSEDYSVGITADNDTADLLDWLVERVTAHGVPVVPAPKPVAYHDKDQPEGIAWCPGYPDGLRDITPLYTADGVPPSAQPEQCWCDKQGIGEPGVSCGDCPTRDYKPATGVPACDPACRGNDSESRCVRTNSPYCGVTNPAGVPGTFNTEEKKHG